MADLIVRESPSRGRGVFAVRGFEAGETIEVCPVIALSAADAARLDDTHLYNYYFGWGLDGKAAAIALGFGSLYNHSYTPNAVYRKNLADGTIEFVALGAIASGDEIFVRYNFIHVEGPDSGSAPTEGAGDQGPLWFEVR